MVSQDVVVVLLTGAGEVGGIFGRLFQAFGGTLKLYTVENGETARAYLQGTGKYGDREHYPMADLLLVDLQVLSIHGSEVLEWVRKQAQFNDLPVVVLAGPNEGPQVSRSYKLGVNAFLTKPPAFGELRAVLQALRSPQTEETKVPDIDGDGAPMVVVKSQFMGLREAFEQQTAVPSRIKALEDIESAKAHLENQASQCKLPLFVDLDLGEDAFELIEWATKSARLAGSRIIVLCTPGDIQGVSRAADSGAELFIVKPVTAKKLSQIGEDISDAWNETTLRQHPAGGKSEQPMHESEGVPQDRERDEATTATINLSGPRILYVAGNPTDRHLFSTAMSQGSVAFTAEFLQGFAEVVEYVRHRGASRRITSASPSCLLLDSATVGEASREILRWIRNQSSFPDVVVVMFSDTDDSNMVKSMYHAGVDYYLVKPKSFASLLSIANIIDSGLRQVPEDFDDLERLPEYRDRFGNPPTPGPANVQCAQ
jgi:DNA-binding response OmpR family regulator